MKGKALFAKPSDGVDTNNGPLHQLPHTQHQDPTNKDHKPGKRKPKRSIPKDPLGSREPATKCRKLMEPLLPLTQGIIPVMTLEVKTANEGITVPERQNANNAIQPLERRFKWLQKTGQIGRMENRVLFYSAIHDTRNLWFNIRFYVLKDGKPKWYTEPIKSVDFSIEQEHGFLKARQFALNLCDYLPTTVYQEILAELAEAFKVGFRQYRWMITQPNIYSHIIQSPVLINEADFVN